MCRLAIKAYVYSLKPINIIISSGKKKKSVFMKINIDSDCLLIYHRIYFINCFKEGVTVFPKVS